MMVDDDKIRCVGYPSVGPGSVMMVDDNKIRCRETNSLFFLQCLLFDCNLKHMSSGGSTYIRDTVYKKYILNITINDSCLS